MTDVHRRALLRGGAAALALLALPGTAAAQVGVIGRDTPVTPADLDWGALPPLDRRLFTIQSHIHGTFRAHARRIWDGYRPDLSPTVLGYAPTEGLPSYAYLLNFRDPGDAEPVRLPRELGLPPVHRVTSGAAIDVFQNPRGTVFAADVTGERALIIGFSTVVRWMLDPSTWLFARVAVHEAFHNYQSTWEGGGEQPFPAQYPRDAENAALALLEDRVLDVPVGQRPSVACQVLRTFAAIRALRHERWPDVAWRDRFYQLAEGTARFAENRYVRLGGHEVFRQVPDLSAGRGLLAWIGRTRGYAVGAWCGELLESVIGPSWRDQAVRGRSPADVAAEFVGAPDMRLVAQAKERHGYAQLLDTVQNADLPNAQWP